MKPNEIVEAPEQIGLTPEQVEARKNHVGASEVAAVFGESSWTTRWKLWREKAGKDPRQFTQSEAMLWGNLLEGAIAQGLVHFTGWILKKAQESIPHPNEPRLSATPDFYIEDDGGRHKHHGVLDVKMINAWSFQEWGAVPPLQYELQLQAQMACTGATWGALACLIGGNQLRVYEYERDEKAIERIVSGVRGFWKSIELDNEPDPEDGDIERWALTTPDGGGETILDGEDHPEILELCREYREITTEQTAAKKRKDAIKAEMVQEMKNAGDARLLVVADAEKEYEAISKFSDGGLQWKFTESKPRRSFTIKEHDRDS